MGKLIDLTGQRFGRLVVVERASTYYPKHKPWYSQPLWRCKCDCGEEIVTYGNHLKKGSTRSCGCLRSETARDLAKKRRKRQ